MLGKTFVILGLISTAACISLFQFGLEEWEIFKIQHKKTYKSETEETFRRKIFFENKFRIAQHNKRYHQGKSTYTLGINAFSDMLPTEFNSQRLGLKIDNMTEFFEFRKANAASFIEPDDDVELPDSIDWREKGAVTPVKDQGTCGSCWAFSTTGSLEGQHFRKTGKLVSLSEQNLLDCDNKKDEACQGGFMDWAFQYITDNHGIDTEESYPYEGMKGECRFNRANVGSDEKGFVDIPTGDEEALQKAVATIGPISIGVFAGDSWKFYKEGILDDPDCNERLDHGVLVVGYGTDEKSGLDYWIVKNSWGKSWGMDGYLKIVRNKNMCGIANAASYPLV